ncbi:MAG: tRNA-dihydrouridine synthase, partial [Methanomicrobiales archaeon]
MKWPNSESKTFYSNNYILENKSYLENLKIIKPNKIIHENKVLFSNISLCKNKIIMTSTCYLYTPWNFDNLKININDNERPVGIQLFGSRPEALKEAAAIAEELKPDFIDINCGCWVKNHVARTEGAGLLKDLPLFEK